MTDEKYPYACLGPDWQTAIQEIIDDYIVELADEHGGVNTKTGEIKSISRYRQAVRHRDEIRAKALKRLQRHASESEWFRQKHNLRPFNWSLETREFVRFAIRTEHAKTPKFRETVPPQADEKNRDSLAEKTTLPQARILETRDRWSGPGKAFAEYQRTGNYPVPKREGLDAIFADLRKRKRQFNFQ